MKCDNKSVSLPHKSVYVDSVEVIRLSCEPEVSRCFPFIHPLPVISYPNFFRPFLSYQSSRSDSLLSIDKARDHL